MSGAGAVTAINGFVAAPANDIVTRNLPCTSRPKRGVARVLPPALLHRLIVLAGARTRVAGLGAPIALEKGAESVIAPVVAARNGGIGRRLAHQEAALGLVAQHRDESVRKLVSRLSG